MKLVRKLPDWLIYAVILGLILINMFGNEKPADTPPPPVLGPALPNATPADPRVIVKIKPAQNGIGTAFAVDDNGTWLTAKHVVAGCKKVGLMLNRNKIVRVDVKKISGNTDTALLVSQWHRPPLVPDYSQTRKIGEYGFFIGFPQGKPGEAAGSLLGRRRMVVSGRYRSNESILAWSEIGRSSNIVGSLGGISGGPVFDKDGEVIGLVSAENVKRGRVYTVAPASLARILPNPDTDTRPEPMTLSNYGRRADRLRRTRQVAQVYCLVK
ncbi:MAG TPA: serine protease [Hellea balneolensis]|uniref:Serine protease n=1 Tax=Hellea balneolensis TaxID=287478 RepID=A0A7C5R7A8_9PROT|nr:serine protease [Hellea balneolensis]